MSNYLLAVDPSLRSTGVALFRDNVLIATSRLSCSVRSLNMGTRCIGVAQTITLWYRNSARGHPTPDLVFEWPQIYRAAKSKGDPNDLVPLAGIGMSLAGMLNVLPITPTPAEWAGQLKKFTKGDVGQSPRALRIRSRLSESELEHWQDQHDVIDAIGLGLWCLGRLAPKRVFPGATK
jgi:hypothetical protein